MRDPDFAGVARAWRLKKSPEMEQAHVDSFGHESSSLADWVVNGSYHPFWSWWYIAVIHLRDIPNAPPANKQYPEAEYEFMILSLDPRPEARNGGKVDVDKIEQGDIEGGLPGFLSPPDVVFQFHGVTDEQAIKVGEAAIRAIVNGHSCDSDFREWWKVSLSKTVEHFVLGVHS